MLDNFKNKDFLISICVGFLFLLASLVVNSYAVEYATDSISNPVTDIVLSNTRVYDVDGILVYGSNSYGCIHNYCLHNKDSKYSLCFKEFCTLYSYSIILPISYSYQPIPISCCYNPEFFLVLPIYFIVYLPEMICFFLDIQGFLSFWLYFLELSNT